MRRDGAVRRSHKRHSERRAERRGGDDVGVAVAVDAVLVMA